jgi:hypothetical protein
MLMIVLPARLGRLGCGWLGQAGHFPQRRRVRLHQAQLARLPASPLTMARFIESTISLTPVPGKATQRRGRALAGKLTFPPRGAEALSIAARFRLGAPEVAHA